MTNKYFLVKELVDNNGDGTPDEIKTYTYDANNNKTSFSYDNNADGTRDAIKTQ